jgi:hypothetical protein
MQNNWYDSFVLAAQEAIYGTAVYIPRIVAALLIIILGAAVAKFLRGLVIRLIEALQVSAAIEKTPIEHFFKGTDIRAKIEDVLGSVFYWIVMLVVLYTAVSVLGLTSLSLLFERVLAYLPNILSAVLVLFLGVLLSGFVETLVKGSIRTIDGKSARLFGKISSYLVMSMAVMIAISELGIAKDFILILFIGFVGTVTLGLGLALGLGGKNVVGKLLDSWYENVREEIRE